MPMFRAFDSWSVCGRLADSTASDRNRGCTQIYPGLPPRRVKTYILLVWSCIVGIYGAVTMVRRCNLAEVEGDGVASLCEFREIAPPSWPPLLALIRGARSRDPVQIGYRCIRTLTSLGLLGLWVSWAIAGRQYQGPEGSYPRHRTNLNIKIWIHVFSELLN
jgi:hypothetical protein